MTYLILGPLLIDQFNHGATKKTFYYGLNYSNVIIYMSMLTHIKLILLHGHDNLDLYIGYLLHELPIEL